MTAAERKKPEYRYPFLITLVFDTNEQCKEYVEWLSQNIKADKEAGFTRQPIGSIGIPKNIAHSISWKHFTDDELAYAFKTYPNLRDNSYENHNDLLTYGEKRKLEHTLGKIREREELEYPVHINTGWGKGWHMLQLMGGLRISFDVEKTKSGITISKIDLQPNSGCTDRTLAGREKAARMTMKQITEALTNNGYTLKEPIISPDIKG